MKDLLKCNSHDTLKKASYHFTNEVEIMRYNLLR